jgi:hypothetical protein
MTKPCIARTIAAVLFLALICPLLAGEQIKSGPQPGALLPGPFDPLNLNGEKKGRRHCLVCEYALHPVVLVFARDSGEGKDTGVNDLLKKLETAVQKYQKPDLKAIVVFLSKDAKSSATDAKVEDPGDLVQEAVARDALIARLTPRIESLKSVVVGLYPAEGPKGYNINQKADVTVLFYLRHKVLANWAFAEGGFKQEDVEAILKKVDETVAKEKKAST